MPIDSVLERWWMMAHPPGVMNLPPGRITLKDEHRLTLSLTNLSTTVQRSSLEKLNGGVAKDCANQRADELAVRSFVKEPQQEGTRTGSVLGVNGTTHIPAITDSRRRLTGAPRASTGRGTRIPLGRHLGLGIAYVA